MPEVSIDENNELLFSEYQVWPSRQILHVRFVPYATPVEQFPHG
jgi:hypothetical protein